MNEIVLPSGRFAAIRTVTWLDYLACMDKDINQMCLKLMARVVTIDGESVTPEQILGMPMEDVFPVCQIVNKCFGSAVKGGIA